MAASVRLNDPDGFGSWGSVSLVGEDGVPLWTRTPPTSAAGDVWTNAELKNGQVLGWTWSCYLVTFDVPGAEVATTFTK